MVRDRGRPPLIAVTGRLFPLGRIERVLEPQVAAPTWYLESIARGGGLSCLLNPTELDAEEAGAMVGRFDGVCVLGGVDVDPSLYGQEPGPHTYGTDRLLDHFDIAVMDAAVAAAVPVLAICRGLQVLNVARGGTLYQHLGDRPDLVPHGVPNGGGGSPVAYEIEPGSRLAAAVGGTSAKGRCHHHQAVDRLGTGLRVTARAPDGIAEALESDDADGWVVAVQWHPEETTHEDPAQQRLFTTLVDEAARRAR